MKKYPLVVIGAGAAGLVVAKGLGKAGKKVLLIEQGNYGGDCTNFGCIPSKSLITSSSVAHDLKGAKTFGIETPPSAFNANSALGRTRAIVAQVRSSEDDLTLAKVGVETIKAQAFFKQPHVLKAAEEEIWAKQVVIATGTSPFIPPIPGLTQTPYLTNETIFDLTQVPESLAVIGGGPIGCELAQAFQRLGTKVTLIHRHNQILNKEDRLAQEMIAKQFAKEGISLRLGAKIQQVQYLNGRFQIALDNATSIDAASLLVCVGRRPNVDSLHLQAAEVAYSEQGIPVDAYGRTNQRHIWAVGDVTGPPFFTHAAEHQARAVLKSLLLPFKIKIDRTQSMPRVTFTDPEVASIGIQEELAAKKCTMATYLVPLTLVDRAITASCTEGFLKIVTKKWTSQILGCTIVAPRAGEMLGEISLAMQAKIPLRRLASLIHPYPTYNQAIRKAADLWLTQTILGAFK